MKQTSGKGSVSWHKRHTRGEKCVINVKTENCGLAHPPLSKQELMLKQSLALFWDVLVNYIMQEGFDFTLCNKKSR